MDSMQKYTIVAQDAGSPLIRNQIWVHLADIWPSQFGIPRPLIGIVSRKNKIEYLIERNSWNRARETLKTHIEKDPNTLRSLMELSETWGEEMNQMTEGVHAAQLSAWTQEDLVRVYEQFSDLQARQYAVGALLPLIDIGGESFIESFLKKILQERLEINEQERAFTILTTPTKDSFSREQEKALLKMAEKIWTRTDVRNALAKSSPEEAWSYLSHIPDVAESIHMHAKTYGWVYYVYQGPVFEEVQFVEFLQAIFKKGHSPQELLTDLEQERKRIREEQEKWTEKVARNEKERELVTLTSQYVWSKPRRKDYQSRSYFHMESFFREWVRRTGTSLRHARAATREQIIAGLQGHVIPLAQLESQYQLHVVTNEQEDEKWYLAQKASEFIDTYVEKTNDQQEEQDVREFVGSVAYPGVVTGKVRVVNTPEDMKDFKEGEVLVAIATTPSIVPAMKKAAAIITDEGGLTCHAAIVSRELKVPCVVGLKRATRVLKNGDEVNVNATNGTVHIIRRVKE